MKKILYILLLISFSINAQTIELANRLRQEQTNFINSILANNNDFYNYHVKSTDDTRLYFDSRTPIVESPTIGQFVLRNSDNVVLNTLVINSGATTGHYFTLINKPDFFTNLIIEYLGETINLTTYLAHTIESIDNRTPQPTLGTNGIFYVDGSVGVSGDGLTPANAFKTMTEGMNQILVGGGYLIYVKAGITYTDGLLPNRPSGTKVTPNAVKGYLNAIGDLDNDVPTDNYTVNIGIAQSDGVYDALDPAKMPLFDGGGRGLLRFYDMGTENYYIWENLQIQNYEQGFRSASDGSGHMHFENIITKDLGLTTENLGVPFFFTGSTLFDAKNVTFKDLLLINGTSNGILYSGNSSLVDNVKVYTNESNGISDNLAPTDYYVVFKGQNNYIKNSLFYKDTKNGDGHSGHGATFKSQDLITEYNGVSDTEIVNILGSVEFRNYLTKNNVAKRLNIHDTPIGKQTEYGTAGVGFMTGSKYNIFEQNLVKDTQHFMFFSWNTEGNLAPTNGNIIRNNVGNGIKRNIEWVDPASGTNTQLDSTKVYNNTFSNSAFFSKVDNVGTVTMTFNQWKNNILIGIPISENTDANNIPLTGHTFDTNDSWDIWLTNGTTLTGTGNLSVDPLFVDSANGDFRLTNASTLKDAGLTLTEVLTDYLNKKRPIGSGYSIGAYEN